MIRELQARGYSGDLCLSAEYSAHERVNDLIAEDAQYVRSLLGQGAQTRSATDDGGTTG